VKAFLQQHQDNVIGVLSGFDRLVLRGTLRSLAYVDGMKSYMSARRILLKDFGTHALEMSTKLKASLTSMIEKRGRPIVSAIEPCP